MTAHGSGRTLLAWPVALAAAVSLLAVAAAQADVNVWTTHGPPGASVAALAVDPHDPATVYAATRIGVFRSADAGRSWTRLNSGLSDTTVAALAIDPINSTTLYAGTGVGVFKSTSGGSTWRPASAGLTALRVTALAIDPLIPTTLYAGQGQCGRGGCGGQVFKSTDGGDTWNTAGLSSYAYALAIDPVSPATLYATTSDGFVARSTDGGDTWRWLDAGFYVSALALNPLRPRTLYAGTFDAGVFKSVDGGDTWRAASDGLPSSAILALGIDPLGPATLYAGGYDGVFKSTDAGASWHALNAGLRDRDDVLALALDPVTPTRVYAGTGDGVFDIDALCGNGVVDSGEECDDRNLAGTDGCTAACTRCGNGIVTRPEECDDGNLIDGDCCSADCRMLAAILAGPIVDPATDHRFLLLAQTRWDTAEAQAVCLGGHLPTIDAAAENDWLYDSFALLGGAGHGLWIGLSDAAQEGTWVWSSGAPLTYTHWGEGEPNDLGGGEDYAYILEPTDPRAGFWNDGTLNGGAIVPNGVVGLADCGNGRIDAGEQCDDGNVAAGDGCTLACTICGDGRLTPPEQCDAGGLADGDGCEADCTLPRCGNAIVDPDEQCDDGNADPSDGCTNACTSCGNDTVTPPEECDDGNLVSNDGCDANCTATACGNGVVTSPEECDDGSLASGDGCDANCTTTACGNGIASYPEECDDGNLVNGDGCDANCMWPRCGNAIVDAGEECDDGNGGEGDGCDSNCTVSRCGNGVRAPTEWCDDGNSIDGDGCDSNCTSTACGNGIVTAGEECDDAGVGMGSGCTIACTICGNGVITPPEECDDGNLACGDGCTAECQPNLAVVAGPLANPANSSRYYLLAPASWLAAEGQAGCLGGRLATVNDAAENAWLYDTFSTYGGSARCLWIGLTTPAPNGAWRWVDGTPPTFTHWSATDPQREGRYAWIIPPSEPQASFWRSDDAAGTQCGLGAPNGVVEISDCGNGRIDPGEACDDGNQVDDDACRVNCSLPHCGDGIVDPGEACDDGNVSPADSCTTACTHCGNGVVAPPEECDDGDFDPSDGCTNACTRCGNGVVTPPEGCDDGNLVDSDGCAADCRLASVAVGNGTAESCSEPALDTALARGRVVTFACGDDPVTIRLTSVKVTTAATSVDGGGTVTLAGGHATPLFRVNQGALTLRRLTIADGSAYTGAAVHVQAGAMLALDDCTLRGHHAWYGGAIYNDGTATLADCTLTDGSALHGGAIFNSIYGALTVAGSTLSRNLAQFGGAIDNEGTASVDHCTLRQNWTSTPGGGGAIANVFESSVLRLSASTLTGNVSYVGGAIYQESGTAALEHCTLEANSTTSGGGGGALYNSGFFVDGRAELTDCTLTGNAAESGGAIFNDSLSTTTLAGCSLNDNHATLEGGAVAISTGGTAVLTNSTLRGNTAGNNGGGISNYGGTSIATGCTLNGNAARFYGGAVFNRGLATLTNCTLTDNSAEHGAGIFLVNTTGVTNCTLAGNHGPAISAGAGGMVRNSIIALSDGSNCDGNPIADGGHNLQWPGTDCGETIPSRDPLLATGGLADHGGPTETIALLPGSPAIDAGDPQVCASPPVNGIDQRGYVRAGAGSGICSIGAYEYASPGPPGGCVGDCDESGIVTIDEVIAAVNVALGLADLSRCAGGDANGDEAISIDELVEAVGAALNGCPPAALARSHPSERRNSP
jgi:cysteine-rich repeat protein